MPQQCPKLFLTEDWKVSPFMPRGVDSIPAGVRMRMLLHIWIFPLILTSYGENEPDTLYPRKIAAWCPLLSEKHCKHEEEHHWSSWLYFIVILWGNKKWRSTPRECAFLTELTGVLSPRFIYSQGIIVNNIIRGLIWSSWIRPAQTKLPHSSPQQRTV